jgi:polyferredoxin
MAPDSFRLLADATLLLHAAFVLFVVAGQIVILIGWAAAWRFTQYRLWRLVHLGSIGFIVLEAWFGVPCPLTVLENVLRVAAGDSGYTRGFIREWLGRLIFYDAPLWVFTALYTAFALLVVVTFIAYPPRRRGGYPRRPN